MNLTVMSLLQDEGDDAAAEAYMEDAHRRLLDAFERHSSPTADTPQGNRRQRRAAARRRGRKVSR